MRKNLTSENNTESNVLVSLQFVFFSLRLLYDGVVVVLFFLFSFAKVSVRSLAFWYVQYKYTQCGPITHHIATNYSDRSNSAVFVYTRLFFPFQ